MVKEGKIRFDYAKELVEKYKKANLSNY